MDTKYRLYNNGTSLCIVLFPKGGGDALLRKEWKLESVGLRSVDIPDRRNLQAGDMKLSSRSTLERGGFEIEIKHTKERVHVAPLTKHGSRLPEQIYTFSQLGVEDYRKTEIDKAMDERTLRATLDKLPMSDETFPPD